jgi:hypothetical protein
MKTAGVTPLRTLEEIDLEISKTPPGDWEAREDLESERNHLLILEANPAAMANHRRLAGESSPSAPASTTPPPA